MACRVGFTRRRPSFDRRVSGQQDVVFLTVLQHTVVDVGTVRQAVRHLIGEDRRFGLRPGLLQQPDIEVADADVPDPLLADELVQRLETFPLSGMLLEGQWIRYRSR